MKCSVLFFIPFLSFYLVEAQNVQYKQDRGGRLIQVSYPNQKGVQYTYDNDGNRIKRTTTSVDTLLLPHVGIISGPTSLCVGSTITLVDTPSGGTWSTNNGSASVIAGVVTGVAAGNVIISYTVTNLYGSTTAVKLITVNPLPSAGTITGFSSVCVGNSITLVDTSSGGSWSSSSTIVTLSGEVVTGVTTGIDTIKYTVTNSCGTAIATNLVTINPLPFAGTITGPSNVCISTPITLSDTSSGGIWSSSFPSATVTGGIVTGVSIGIDTIRYTVTNSCGAAVASKAVTVNAIPYAGVISGPSSVCVGSSITLSDTTAGGSWSVSTGIATVISGVVTGMSSGVDTVKYTATNVCGTTVAMQEITVNPLPNSGIITGPSIGCVGVVLTLTDTAGVGAWSSTNPLIATVSGGVITNVSPGIDTIKYTVTNSCGTSNSIKLVTVNVEPIAGTITGASSVCVGASLTLADTSGGGVWSSTNPSIATISGGIVSGISSGIDTLKYTITNSCGTAIAIQTITINPLPNSGIITGSSIGCIGVSLTLTDTSIGGTWSSSNPLVATVLGGAVTSLLPGVDTIKYTITNSCGTSIASKLLTVDAIPSAGTITGISVVCVSDLITLTDTTPGGIWSSTSPSIATVVAGLITGLIAGNDTIKYSVINSCGTDIVNKLITVNPLPVAGTIAGSSGVCIDSSITLIDTAPGGVWNASSGGASVSGGIVTGVSPGVDSIKYIVTNSCGTAMAFIIVSVDAIPIAGTITGASNICAGAILILSDTAPGGLWNSSNSTTSISGGIITGISSGIDTISYTVSNICGSVSATKVITINPIPSSGTITGPTILCQGGTITLSDTIIGGVWSSLDGIAGISGLGEVFGIAPGLDTVVYIVTDSCGTTTSSISITVLSLDSCYLEGTNNIRPNSFIIRIYPNPTEGLFTIDIPETKNVTTIAITDVLGKTIESRKIVNSTSIKEVFDFNNVARGTYLISVNSDGHLYRDKMEIW